MRPDQDKGFAARDAQLQFLKVDPALDTLLDDPRFADLILRVGLSTPEGAGSPQ